MAFFKDLFSAFTQGYAAVETTGKIRDNTETILKYIGLGNFWRKNIVEPYKKFEQEFIARHPGILRAYNFIKNRLNEVLTFAVSETGCRFIGMATLVTTSIASHGIIPAIGAGIYGASIAIALTQQVFNKVKLNKISEEAELLKRYVETYAKKINLAEQKNINFIVDYSQDRSHSKVPIELPKKGRLDWLDATNKYLSTYAMEVAVPIALSALAPVYGIAAGVKFGIFVASAASGIGVGVYLRKQQEQKREELKLYIKEANQHSFIPGYNNIAQLREYIIKQDIELKALQKIPDGLKSTEAEKIFAEKKTEIIVEPVPILQDKSIISQHWQAFKEVINPYDDANKIPDPKAFISAITRVTATVTVTNAALGIGMKGLHAVEGILASSVTAGVGATLIVGAAKLFPDKKNDHSELKSLSLIEKQHEIAISRKKEVEIVQKRAAEEMVKKTVINRRKSYAEAMITQKRVRALNRQNGLMK